MTQINLLAENYKKELQESDENLSAMLTHLDSDFADLLQTYCQHTGKPCRKIDYMELETIVKIHGKSTAIELLQYTQKAVSPEWIWVNSKGLDSLALHQPKEYFVYTIGALLSSTDEKFNIDLFTEKRKAWQNLQSVDEAVIRPIAELGRRIIAKARPSLLIKSITHCKAFSLGSITKSLESLAKFQMELELILKSIIAHEEKEEQYELLGWRNFRGQSITAALSDLEIDLRMELNDWQLIPDRDHFSPEVVFGRKYAKAISKSMIEKQRKLDYQEQDKRKYTQKTVVNPKGFSGLKLGKKNGE